jgi:hypothetical protein
MDEPRLWRDWTRGEKVAAAMNNSEKRWRNNGKWKSKKNVPMSSRLRRKRGVATAECVESTVRLRGG